MDSTPAPSFQQENLGQVFYNSTSNAFKVTKQSVPAGTWASGGNLNTARAVYGASGTQTCSYSFWSRVLLQTKLKNIMERLGQK
jgi:hypothetical protein